MRGREEKEGGEEMIVWLGELEDMEMLYITHCHTCQIGLLLKLDKTAAFKKPFALSQCFD